MGLVAPSHCFYLVIRPKSKNLTFPAQVFVPMTMCLYLEVIFPAEGAGEWCKDRQCKTVQNQGVMSKVNILRNLMDFYKYVFLLLKKSSRS